MLLLLIQQRCVIFYQGLLVTGGHRQSLEIRKIWCPETLPQQLLTSGSNFDNSTRILFLMVGILVLILLSTLYLLFRLQSLQEKIDSSYMRYENFTSWLSLNFICNDRASVTFPIEQILGWQNRLHSLTSKKIQEYLDINFQQIVKVRPR